MLIVHSFIHTPEVLEIEELQATAILYTIDNNILLELLKLYKRL